MYSNYVLHFSDGTHYWGRTSDYKARMKAHGSGKGSKWVAYKLRQGCSFNAYVLATFEDNAASRQAERRIKQNGHRRRHCPECDKRVDISAAS